MSVTDARRDGKGGPHGIDESFGPGAVRLSGRAWLVTAAIVAAVLAALPFAWKRIEPLPPGPDLRVPYRLGSDYWTYARLVEQAAARDATLVVGDSVVWGHYVAKDETLSGCLNALGGAERFANLGVDGIHPLALEGLVAYYGGAAAGRRVVLHCNLLWMSSERHDLRVAKEFAFNHPRLVPQFDPWIPCYREPVAGRLAIVIGRRLPFSGWANHLRVAYWDDLDLASWTLEHPYECPAGAVTLRLPSPDEPPSPAPDARPWTAKGVARFAPAWVDLEGSLQWAAFRRTVETLLARGSRVFVLVGPFNEPMLEPASLAAYQERVGEVAAWLGGRGIPYRVPAALPSACYADASHPLADGYRLLAEGLLADEAFRRFCGLGRAGEGRAE